MGTFRNKTARTEYEILNLLKQRWSPRSFSDKKVEKEKLQKIFEAARWSASCFNEQPWRFIVGIKGDGENYEKLFSCFNENNQLWVKTAPVIFFICSKNNFSYSDKPNPYADYDAGQAAAHLSIQAMSENIYVHQMAGIHKDKIIELFEIPDTYHPVAGFALGYLGDPEVLPDQLKEKELADRTRNPLNRIVYSDKWENTSNIVK